MVLSVIPAQYFSAKRGLANGLVFAGGGCGGAAIRRRLDARIPELGGAWAYRILGLTTLATGLPAAWLIKERNPTRNPGFIEWYACSPYHPFAPRTSDSNYHSRLR